MGSTFRGKLRQTTVAWFTVFGREPRPASSIGSALDCIAAKQGMRMSSRVRLVVVMDPIESIKPAKDSTLAILLAAQARGWQLFYAEQKHLWLRDGVAWGRLAPLQVFDDLAKWYVRGETQSVKLGDFDVILM